MSSRFLDISNPDCKEKETKLYFARSVGLNSLRVIRQTEKSKSELFNLSILTI